MSKKQHRSQSNLKDIAIAQASKEEKAQPKKKAKKEKEILIELNGMDTFNSRGATLILKGKLKKSFTLALIVTPAATMSLRKLDKAIGEQQEYRVSHTNRRAYKGTKAECTLYMGEHIAMTNREKFRIAK